jgi:uncharacterized protein (TIGR02270 family)
MKSSVAYSMVKPSPYRHIYEQYAEEASFLWHLRSIVVDQPHYRIPELAALEQRIEAQLDGLMTSPEESWQLCEPAMESQDPSNIFAASVLAFRSLDVTKIQRAVEGGLANEKGCKGLVSALGWLPGRLCHSWIKKFLTSKDFEHKYLAVAACSVRREDPRDYLTNIFQRPDCLAHKRLYARALRLVGELKRHDLMPALRIAMRAEDPGIRFRAHWSAVMLGDKSVVGELEPFVLAESSYQKSAIEVAFRCLPVNEGRAWISRLAGADGQIRNVLKATAILGDPHAVNWLIAQMQNPALSRLAGEAFVAITGIDLGEHHLVLRDLPNLEQQFPNDDPADEDVAMDEDENLPFPDYAKVAAVWQKYSNRFNPGQRYLLGKPVSIESLGSILQERGQRLHHAAAMELALANPSQLFVNTRAKVQVS